MIKYVVTASVRYGEGLFYGGEGNDSYLLGIFNTEEEVEKAKKSIPDDSSISILVNKVQEGKIYELRKEIDEDSEEESYGNDNWLGGDYYVV